MFQDPAFIKTMSIVALVLFIFSMVAGIVITVVGIQFIGTTNGLVSTISQGISIDDPGSGWLFLGRVLGGLSANLLSAFAVVFGIICVIGSAIVYFPAFIAFIIYKSTDNITAYWILMGIWLALSLISFIILIFG